MNKMLLPKGRTCKDCTSFNECNSFFNDLDKNKTCKWNPNGFKLNKNAVMLDKLAFTLMFCNYWMYTNSSWKKDILAVRKEDIKEFMKTWNNSIDECNDKDRYTCLTSKLIRYYDNARHILDLIDLKTLNKEDKN